MLLTLLVLAAFIAWRMMSATEGISDAERTNAPVMQAGMTVLPAQETYACKTTEAVGRNVAFRITGAKDKLRGQLEQKECVLIAPQQRLKIAALKGKLAQVEADAQAAPLWVPAHDLVPADTSPR
jgi:hypothetical protein